MVVLSSIWVEYIAATNEIEEASKKYPETKRELSARLMKLITTIKANRTKPVSNIIDRLYGISKLFFDSNEKNWEIIITTRINPENVIAGFNPENVFPVSLGTR